MKKIVKIVLVGLMVIGAAVAVSNLLEKHIYAGKWTTYYPGIPDCKDPGDTCYDMTTPDTIK